MHAVVRPVLRTAFIALVVASCSAVPDRDEAVEPVAQSTSARSTSAGSTSAQGADADEPAIESLIDPAWEGHLRLVGSDTMHAVALEWCRLHSAFVPDARCELDCRGSSTALPALFDGRADVGAVARTLKSREREQAATVWGNEPDLIRVGSAATVIVANPASPLSSLHVDAVLAVFYGDLDRETPGITSWGDLVDDATWSDAVVRPIACKRPLPFAGPLRRALFSRRNVSRPLRRAVTLAENVRRVATSRAVVDAVRADRHAIGVCSFGDATGSGLTVLAVSGRDDARGVSPTRTSITDGRYPFAHALYLVLPPKADDSTSPPGVSLCWIALSRRGQSVLEAEGFVALPDAWRTHETARLR